MSTATISDAVRAFAAEVGADDPVAVVGGRTRWQLGGGPTGDPRLVRAPQGVVSHVPSEMLVRVLAGTAVADLDAALRVEGQRCALPDRGGTVGGAVAVGENHLEMLGRGRVRDAVLQVRYVSAEGDVVTGGGAVVKNVSGFNIPKLVVGSLGTLGLVAELALRTNPLPSSAAWWMASDADPRLALDSLHRPSSVLWDGASTWVHLEGHRADIDAEVAALARVGRFMETEGPPELPPNRWSMTPVRAATLDPTGPTGRFVASIGVGTVFAEHEPPQGPADPASRHIAERMKALFDPSGRLNPGRVAGGGAWT